MADLLHASSSSPQDLSGLVGVAADVIEALGEWGVGLLTLVETIFPPIPSEIVLPLAGFLTQTGQMNFILVWITSTLGAYIGALVLYWLGAALGLERSIRWLSKLPLVDRKDFEKAANWFSRHGRKAVFFGRLLPGIRSVVSLPAGAAKMNLVTFSVFTIAGSALWNVLLLGLGAALGTQYALIDQHSHYLDSIVIGAIAALILWLVIRRARRNHQTGAESV